MKKVSVIIPVYNCEKTIRRTLESITKQTYNEYEVIIVNDGSKDNSYQIISDYIKNDNRFKLVDQKNSGVSNARNKALSLITGDYICFIDGDDWISPDYFENITIDLDNHDMVFYSYIMVGKEDKIKSCDDTINNSSKKDFFEGLHNASIFSPMCSKVFSKRIIKDIRFNEKMTKSEDADFTFQCFKNTDNYIYKNKAFYYYDINAGNLGFNYKNNKFKSKIYVYEKYEKFYEENNWNKKFVNNFYAKTYILDLVNHNIENGYSRKKYEKYKKELNDTKQFDKKNVSRKYYYVLKIFDGKYYFITYFASLFIRLLDILYKRIKIGKK